MKSIQNFLLESFINEGGDWKAVDKKLHQIWDEIDKMQAEDPDEFWDSRDAEELQREAAEIVANIMKGKYGDDVKKEYMKKYKPAFSQPRNEKDVPDFYSYNDEGDDEEEGEE